MQSWKLTAISVTAMILQYVQELIVVELQLLLYRSVCDHAYVFGIRNESRAQTPSPRAQDQSGTRPCGSYSYTHFVFALLPSHSMFSSLIYAVQCPLHAVYILCMY